MLLIVIQNAVGTAARCRDRPPHPTRGTPCGGHVSRPQPYRTPLKGDTQDPHRPAAPTDSTKKAAQPGESPPRHKSTRKRQEVTGTGLTDPRYVPSVSETTATRILGGRAEERVGEGRSSTPGLAAAEPAADDQRGRYRDHPRGDCRDHEHSGRGGDNNGNHHRADVLPEAVRRVGWVGTGNRVPLTWLWTARTPPRPGSADVRPRFCLAPTALRGDHRYSSLRLGQLLTEEPPAPWLARTVCRAALGMRSTPGRSRRPS